MRAPRNSPRRSRVRLNYFDLTFQADAGVAYHLWLRGKADKILDERFCVRAVLAVGG